MDTELSDGQKSRLTRISKLFNEFGFEVENFGDKYKSEYMILVKNGKRYYLSSRNDPSGAWIDLTELGEKE